MFEYTLLDRARAAARHIVLPEGTDERVLRAADILLRRRVVELTLLGPEAEVRGAAARLGLDLVRRARARPDRSGAGRALRGRVRDAARAQGRDRRRRRATSSPTSPTSAR